MTNFNNNTFEAKDLDEMSEHEGVLKNGLKQSLEGSDTLKNFFTDWNPILQIALEKIARGHNVTFDTALAAFLGMCSVAIGGNKRIVSGKWEEKGLLWMAFHAPTGKGKTPLFRDCGREVMAKKNEELNNEDSVQQRDFERWKEASPDRRGERPEVFPRMIWTTYVTLETLTNLHINNPSGIGLIYDELDALISGRNQYKGKGDDVQKMLEFWNGREFSNPTMNKYRYLPDSFVPIIGGIQTDLLKKLFNAEDIANGFVARFLLVPFRHPVPTLIDSERKKIRDTISSEEWNSTSLMIEQLIKGRDIKEQFQLEKDAETLIYQQHDELTKDSNKNLQEMESSFNKLKTYSFRFSLLLHCLKGEIGKVSARTVADAITLVQWYTDNMKDAFYSNYSNENQKNYKKILERLRQTPHPLSIKELYSSFRRSFKGYQPIREIICKLQQTGIVKEDIVGKEIKYSAKPFL
jgi:hypothetical protein